MESQLAGVDERRYQPQNVWDTYSKNWEKYHVKEKFLGDEWTPPIDEIKKKFIEPFLQKKKNMTTLEIGPGGGKWTEFLLELSYKVILVDISKEMLNRTKKRFPTKKLELVQTDGITISGITPMSVDFLFSYDAFVHMEPRDIYNYLKQCYLLMKPEGIGVIQYPNILSKNGWQHFVASIKPDNLLNRRTALAYSVMTLEIMTKFLTDLGFNPLFSEQLPRNLMTAFMKP